MRTGSGLRLTDGPMISSHIISSVVRLVPGKRAFAISGGNRIERRHVVFDGPIGSSAGPSMESLRLAMARHVRSVVDRLDGNRTRAAKVLDCTPKTVRKYLEMAEEVE